MENTNFLTQSDLDKGIHFFSHNSVETLTAMSTKINIQQPAFSGMVLAWQKLGISMDILEDLLESIFVIYYAHTEVRNKKIATLSAGSIAKNLIDFKHFIKYYNKEDNAGQEAVAMAYLKDKVATHHGLTTLETLFSGLDKVPQEVVFGYVALLKGIEYKSGIK